MGKKYIGVIIKQIATDSPRNISVTSRYMQKLQEEGHETPVDNQGILSGSFNCVSENRKGQLKEIDSYLKLHGNLKSSQAASHQIISYPDGFTPTRQQIIRDIGILLKKYGMEDHPAVWDAHTDTGNFHIHLLVSRVSLVPDADGKYPIANNGAVKKLCQEQGREDRWRTDWSGCRQAAIAEIGHAYGWGTPRNVRMTADCKPRPRQDPKDNHSDKTRIGERKTGNKSKQRMIAEFAKKVFDLAAIESIAYKKSFWSVVDRDFKRVGITQNIKFRKRKLLGGVLVGPGNHQSKFSNVGPGYSFPKLIKQFGAPKKENFQVNETVVKEPFAYSNELTIEEAKKRLLPVFKEAATSKSWNVILEFLQKNYMYISFTGGGAVIKFNDGKDAIKFSEVNNKYSLKKLEAILGEFHLEKHNKNSIEDDALISKLRRNEQLIVTLAFLMYENMILNHNPQEPQDVRLNDVSPRSERMDSGSPRNIDPAPAKPLFKMQ